MNDDMTAIEQLQTRPAAKFIDVKPLWNHIKFHPKKNNITADIHANTWFSVFWAISTYFIFFIRIAKNDFKQIIFNGIWDFFFFFCQHLNQYTNLFNCIVTFS